MSRQDRSELVGRARAALVIAAMRRSILTYKELGCAVGLDGIALRNEMRYVLDDLSVQCAEAKEPSLAALVVNARSGEPGAGWHDGAVPWHAEVQQVFRHWAATRD